MAIFILAANLLAIAALRVGNLIYRRHCERLMRDINSLKLEESDWNRAQTLIARWGRYGRYEGDCNVAFCRYKIHLESPLTTIAHPVLGWSENPVLHKFFGLIFFPLEYLGGQGAWLGASFVVQDGIVQRKAATFFYLSPVTNSFQGTALIGAAHSSSQVGDSDGWILTGTDQFEKHPYYAVTRPGGCTFCMMAKVTFAVNTPSEQMEHLLTFNFSCMTGLRPCRYLDDVYPAAEEWNLYGGEWSRSQKPDRRGPPLPVPLICRVPLFARGREANQIVSVTVLDKSQSSTDYEVNEIAHVRVDGTFKGDNQFQIGQVLTIYDHSDDRYTPLQIEKPLIVGQKFLLLAPTLDEEKKAFAVSRCAVIPDTTEARADLMQPAARLPLLRFSDPDGSDFIPGY